MAAAPQALPNGLPQNYRYITDHNTEGKAIFSNRVPEAQAWSRIDGRANFALNYTTTQYPVSFKDNQDIGQYEKYLQASPGLVVAGGSVLRVVDMSPGALSPMHRTVSIDYGVVLEGEVYLELDSGEKRLMRRGDIAVQRGTNHAWRNASSTEWSRMLYVLLEAQPLKIRGQALGEVLGDMTNVMPSTYFVRPLGGLRRELNESWVIHYAGEKGGEDWEDTGY